jgi:serine/threonine-protein kinase HipA
MSKTRPVPVLHVALAFGDRPIKVGRLAEANQRIYFEYDPAFKTSGIELSPLKLPLTSGVTAAKYQPFEGLWGVFNDSLPDGWGRLLLDRALASRGVDAQALSPLDRLAYVGQHGMGALVYQPGRDLEDQPSGGLDLNLLADEMANIQEGEASQMLDQLFHLGGSSQGARPKVLVGYNPTTGLVVHGALELSDDYQHWLIKFPSSLDRPDIAQIEQAYALMAKAAGLEMAETHLFKGNRRRMYFGTRRFDRVGSQRLHMHTAAGLLQADHRVPSLDYELLMQCALYLKMDLREAEKLFRMAAFNVLAHNQDDHGKNFSFLMEESGAWRLAPAYDLTFSYGPARQHCTTVMGSGLPGLPELKKLGEKFSIRERKSILEEVRDAISRWKQFATEAGVSNTSQKLIWNTIGAS